MCQRWVAVMHCLWWSTVDLERNSAGQLAGWIFNCNTEFAIDRRPDTVTYGQNFVPVPAAFLNNINGVIIPVQFTTAVFMIQIAPYIADRLVVTDVRLITHGLPVSIYWFRAKLNACVSVARCQFDVHGKVKILYFNVGPDELVPRYVRFRVANDSVVLD